MLYLRLPFFSWVTLSSVGRKKPIWRQSTAMPLLPVKRPSTYLLFWLLVRFMNDTPIYILIDYFLYRVMAFIFVLTEVVFHFLFFFYIFLLIYISFFCHVMIRSIRSVIHSFHNGLNVVTKVSSVNILCATGDIISDIVWYIGVCFSMCACVFVLVCVWF